MVRWVAVIVLAIAVAGCSAQTDPATDITATSATLNGHSRCTADLAGSWRWELRSGDEGDFEALDTNGATAGTDKTFDCPADEQPGTPGYQCTNEVACENDLALSLDVTGLHPGGLYYYRIAADINPPGGGYVALDADGTTNGTNYDNFFTELFAPGLVTTADPQKSCRVAQARGARHIRLEFDIATEPAAMESLIDYCRDRGVRALLLAGFESRTPTQAEAENLADWADAFGPGGSFGLGDLAVQQIEFGNETSYCGQYGHNVGSGPCAGAWYTASSYSTLAGTYATRVEQAAAAIAPADVDLLAQADNGGVGNQWVHAMFASQPDLDDSVDGWTVHPYGPETAFDTKLDAAISHLAAEGADTSIPLDVTEYGIATDCASEPPTCSSFTNGNFGWPVDMTYAEAGSALTSIVADARADYGSRLRDFMVYQAHDNQAHGANTNRESFLGCVLSSEAAKGAYTTACESVLDE